MTNNELAGIRHVVLDLDGTLYRGSRLFDETLPFLAKLRVWNIGCTFLTNNTSRSKADYVEKLRNFGIAASEEQIYTPADSTIVYLHQKLPAVKSIAVLGTPSLCEQFEQAGFSVDWNSRPPKIVQVSGNAAEAGLQAGDVLSEIDGNKTEDALSVLKLVGAKQPGDYIIVKVLRARKPMNFTYALAER